MDTDVVIVGFGPVGATLASLLGARGIRTVVLERELGVYPLPRAAHIDHQGLRTLQEVGCLEQVLPGMVRNRSLDLVNANRELLVRVPADQPSISGLPLSMYFYQPQLDRLLRDAAGRKSSVEIRVGVEMTGYTASSDGVKVRYKIEDGNTGALDATWMVGCDGAWSSVREGASLSLENLGFDEQWLVLDLALNKPQPHLPLDHALQVCDPARPYTSTPISPDRQRFEFMLLPGERPEEVTQRAFVDKLLHDWIKPEAFEVARDAVYTFHGLLATKWRVGRVLIAGDAAHQMPPFLGQGMCSGLRDGANLAWKLDLVINGSAPESLLDTYERERRPHVRTIVESAIKFGQLVCELDPARAKARDQSLSSKDHSSQDCLSFNLPKLERSPLVLENGGALFVQPTIDGKRLDDIVGPRFLVLVRHVSQLGDSAAWSKAQGALVATTDELHSDALLKWLDRYGHDVVIVRPDRYVLGAGKTLDDMTRRVEKILSAAPVPGDRQDGGAQRRERAVQP